AHFRSAVAAVSDEDAAAPVQPAIAVFVIDRKILSAIPDQRRLASHRQGLEPAQQFESCHRVRMRQLSNNSPMRSFDARDSARDDAEFFAHKVRIESQK